MRDYIREVVYSDKLFDNPVLGKVSCGAFNQTMKTCKQYNLRNKSYDPCLQLKQATSMCYSAKNSEEINNYIRNQFEEGLMLRKFLQAKESTLLEKLAANTWAVFTNPRNLDIYEKIRVTPDQARK